MRHDLTRCLLSYPEATVFTTSTLDNLDHNPYDTTVRGDCTIRAYLCSKSTNRVWQYQTFRQAKRINFLFVNFAVLKEDDPTVLDIDASIDV